MSTTPLASPSPSITPLFFISVFLCAVVTAGCGPHQIPSTAAQEVGDLKPAVEDVDAGTMRMRPGFSPGTYTVIIVTPFKVSTTGVSDDGQSRLAQDMIRPLQSQLLKRLQLAGIFATVVDATASGQVAAGEKSLRLEGDITSITQGSRALRAVGLGMGAGAAEMETRLVDAQSQNVELVTSDWRNAPSGAFGGGDSRKLVSQVVCEMAENYVKMLERLSGRHHATVTSGPPCVVTSEWPVAAGAEVRVLAPALGDKKQIGVVASATQDTLFFRQEPQISTRPIGVRDITQLEIAQGTHTHRMRNLRIGFSIAALVGGAIGAARTKTHPACQPNTICLNLDSVDRFYNAMVGGLLGGGVGALIGASSGDVETTWVPVPLPRAH